MRHLSHPRTLPSHELRHTGAQAPPGKRHVQDHHRIRRHGCAGGRAGARDPRRPGAALRGSRRHAAARLGRGARAGAGRCHRRRRGLGRRAGRATRTRRRLRRLLRDQLLGALLTGSRAGPGQDHGRGGRARRRGACHLVDAGGHPPADPARYPHARAQGPLQRAALRRQGRGRPLLPRKRRPDHAAVHLCLLGKPRSSSAWDRSVAPTAPW